jgi:hypothetical protein
VAVLKIELVETHADDTRQGTLFVEEDLCGVLNELLNHFLVVEVDAYQNKGEHLLAAGLFEASL